MSRQAVQFAPSTFEERGTAVSFTTPMLSQTRIRKDDRDRLEILVPSFSAGKGIYVIPWKAVPEMVSMTVHDRCLHRLIVREPVCSPNEVRTASLRVARTGLAGPPAAAAADAALREDENHRTLANYMLIVGILEAVGLDSADILTAGLDTDQGQLLARALMARAAASLKLTPTELFARVEELSDAICPIGLERAPKPGRLRRRVADLSGCRDKMAEWSRTAPEESAPVARFCADVAGLTIDLGREVLGAFNEKLRDIETLLSNWHKEMPHIRNLSIRLAWLLDGWDYVVACWAEAEDKERQEQCEAMEDIFRVLPLVPTREATTDMHAEKAKVARTQRRTVRPYEDLRTGERDLDMIQRIERVKAKAA